MGKNNFVHKVNLHPSDVMFFKDARPMDGSMCGIGNTLPSPHTFNGAMRAAFCGNSNALDADSMLTVGPFVADAKGIGQSYFKTPADIVCDGDSGYCILSPLKGKYKTSLINGLNLLFSSAKPTKAKVSEFMAYKAFSDYLNGEKSFSEGSFYDMQDFCSTESYVGISIDNSSFVAKEGIFYSKKTMRLKPGFGISGYVKMLQRKGNNDLLPVNCGKIDGVHFGGDNGMCSMSVDTADEIDLPHGAKITGNCVKYVLLTPAIFTAENGNCGGWLPNWVSKSGEEYKARLLNGPGAAKAKRLRVTPGTPIDAKLVAVRTEKPVLISGWGAATSEKSRPYGAKSSLLAVPAGSVYYFEAKDLQSAKDLADALNWHGKIKNDGSDFCDIVNTRSALMGEKGFGIGVCGNWSYSKEEI